MGKKFSLIVILVFLSFNSVLLWKSLEMKKTYVENTAELQNKFDKFKDQSSYNFGMILKYRNQLISTNVIDSTDRSNMLLYLYSNNECPSCIIEDIEAIGKFAIDNFVNNVLIIPINDESQLKNTFLNNIYKDLKRHPVICEPNTYISRCFCLIDSTGEIFLPYFSRIGYEENRNQYLDFVFNQFFVPILQ